MAFPAPVPRANVSSLAKIRLSPLRIPSRRIRAGSCLIPVPLSADRTLSGSTGEVVKYQEIRSIRACRQLQDRQLAFHRASRHPVVLHLTSGVRLHGVVVGADAYMVLLATAPGDPAPQIVYKHAIAAITPDSADGRPIELPRDEVPPEFVRLFTPRTRSRRRA